MKNQWLFKKKNLTQFQSFLSKNILYEIITVVRLNNLFHSLTAWCC